ncbi:hypothetical protein EI012_27505, partial [Escherichia coli]|nr:hypothetical protein [Escherichia coli]
SVSASLPLSLRLRDTPKSPPSSPRLNFAASFATGSPLTLLIPTSYERKTACKAKPISIRCEQSTQDGNSLDVWLGRLAMVGFAVAITVEIATGKGLLENFGV